MSPGVLPAVITVSSWKSLYGLTVAPCLPKHDAPRLRSPPRQRMANTSCLGRPISKPSGFEIHMICFIQGI